MFEDFWKNLGRSIFESHGSGMPLWGDVGKVFSLHVREQIPVCSSR